MGTEIQVSKDFQTRMFERVRDTLGDLMTDEELKKVLAVSIEKAFFEQQIVLDRSGYGSPRESKVDSVFVTEVRKLLAPKVEAAVGVWFRENEAKIGELLAAQFKDGLASFVVRYFDQIFNQHVFNLQNGIEESLRRAGIIRS